MKMHTFPRTTSGPASATVTAAHHKEAGASRWLATLTGLPIPATLPLPETRWSQRRAGNPLWRLIAMQKSAPTQPPAERPSGSRRPA